MACTRTLVIVVLVLASCSALPRGTPTPRASASATTATPGAVFTEEVVSATGSVWGHGAAGGVDHLPGGSLPRLDLLQGVRDHAPSEACRRAVVDVLVARAHLHVGALRMQASSASLPDALLAASMYALGDFDGCLSLPEAVYCLLDVEVRPAGQSAAPLAAHPGDEKSPYTPPHAANATLWDLLQTSGNRRRYRRDLQQWAVCLPSACGPAAKHPLHAKQAAASLGRSVAAAVADLARTLGLQLRLHVEPADCSDTASRRADADLWTLLKAKPGLLLGTAFILSFPALMLVASVRAVVHRVAEDDGQAPNKPGALGTVMECFALQTTWGRLCRFQSSQIHSIQGLRTLTMFLVIWAHSGLYLFGGPVLNPDFVESAQGRVLKSPLVSGVSEVATFFVISGFLEARLSMMHIGKLRHFHLMVVLQHYVIRFLRLLPALAVMLAVEALWLQHLGSGPTWGPTVGRVAQDCRQHWWTHLLFVNNYLAPESLCMMQTRFTAAVLQMYSATPLIMWLVSRWTLRALWPGCLVLGLLLAVASGAHYFTTLRLGLHPVVLTFPQALRQQNVVSDATFAHLHVQTHTNAVPYLVGLIVGTLFYLANRREWRPSKTAGTLMWLGIPLGLVLMLATVLSGVVFLVPSFEARPLLDAAYGPARLLGLALPTAWIIFACGMGQGGVFDAILAWPPLVALGRLTYSVYLVHLAVVILGAGATRQPVYLSNYDVICRVLANMYVSYAAGLALHCCVEAPLANLQSIATSYWFHASGSAALTKERGPDDAPAPAPEAPDDSEDVHEDTSRRSSTCTTRRASTCTTCTTNL